MPFNKTAVNYATSYQQALAQAYPYVLYFADLYKTENDNRYRWINAKTIAIPVLDVAGRKDNNRDTITAAARNYNNSWENKTLENERTWSTLVHPEDIDETNFAVTIQNITQVMNEEQKFPEKDRYLISKIYADYTAASKAADTTAVTSENILTLFDAQMEAMTNARVPKSGRIWYMTTSMNRILKSAITRYIANGDENIRRIIASIDDVKIVEIPTDIMWTVFDFTEGSVKGSGAKQINWLLVHPSAVITPEKYSFASLDQPSALTQGKYYYYEEAHEDVFVLNRRLDAIQFSVSAT